MDLDDDAVNTTKRSQIMSTTSNPTTRGPDATSFTSEGERCGVRFSRGPYVTFPEDRSQRDRILSHPSSVLSFATYHHEMALEYDWQPDGNFASEGIAIETLANGEQRWRWVPPAHGVQKTSEEGRFPRKVLRFGKLTEMKQHEWDIYKLDPFCICAISRDRSQYTVTLDEGDSEDQSTPGPSSDNVIHTTLSSQSRDAPSLMSGFKRASDSDKDHNPRTPKKARGERPRTATPISARREARMKSYGERNNAKIKKRDEDFVRSLVEDAQLALYLAQTAGIRARWQEERLGKRRAGM